MLTFSNRLGVVFGGEGYMKRHACLVNFVLFFFLFSAFEFGSCLWICHFFCFLCHFLKMCSITLVLPPDYNVISYSPFLITQLYPLSNILYVLLGFLWFLKDLLIFNYCYQFWLTLVSLMSSYFLIRSYVSTSLDFLRL